MTASASDFIVQSLHNSREGRGQAARDSPTDNLAYVRAAKARALFTSYERSLTLKELGYLRSKTNIAP